MKPFEMGHPGLGGWAGCVLVLLFSLGTMRAQAPSLYAQSIQIAVADASPKVEVYLLDLRTGETLANTFHQPAAAIPVGSLLKPFVALAYFQTHAEPRTVVCHGKADRCWKPEGHGGMTLTDAIAQSCNAYFLALAKDVGSTPLPYLPPPPNARPETLMGLAADWRIAPETLVRAYAKLLAGPASATQRAILAGMRGSAEHGTAAHIGRHPGGVLAKTGTAPCVDARCAATGDGLTIAVVPATLPTLLLLVRQRATNGSTTAIAAGRVLTQLESLHAE